MTMTVGPTPTTARRAPSPPARLVLIPADATPGLLDGAWWPRSRDLFVEIPALAAVLDHRWGRITRLTVNPEHWPVIPRKIPVTGHVVRVGSFTDEQDPHKVLLLSYSVGRLDLLVIPPHTGVAAAARLMAAATDPRTFDTASALIAHEGATTDASPAERDPEAEWESEGGAWPSPLEDPVRPPSLAREMCAPWGA